jgi:hypothetical protein
MHYIVSRALFWNNARDSAIHFTNLFMTCSYVTLARDIHPNVDHSNLPRLSTLLAFHTFIGSLQYIGMYYISYRNYRSTI